MIKLFLRNYLLFIFVIIFIIIATFLMIQVNIQNTYNYNATELARGPMQFLQKQLAKMPEDKWHRYLAKTQNTFWYQKVKIINQSELPKALKDSSDLNQGKIVGHSFNHAILPPFAPSEGGESNIYSDFYAYQKIAGTPYYLALPSFFPPIVAYKLNSQWIAYIIRQSFQHVSAKNYPETAEYISHLLGVSAHIHKTNTLSLFDQQMLKKWHMLANSFNHKHSVKVSFLLPDTNYYLSLGKVAPSFFLLHFDSIAILFALIVLLGLTWFLSYPFYRSIQKLQTQLARFGQGDFSFTTHIPKAQALKPLQKSIDHMGEQLKTLIESHKELTNAIAHEIKTPLARIQFALEITKEINPQIDSKYLDGASDDIEELNTLINELLLHAKLDRKNTSLQLDLYNLNSFLCDMTTKYQSHYPQKSWQFMCNNEDFHSKFDHKYLTRALDNILLNAYTHGGDFIRISLTKQQASIQIIIEDDGKGVTEDNYQKIFLPFETLSSSRNKKTTSHGLGLSIVQKIISAHNGEIQAQQSATLGGLAIVITLH